MAISLRTSGSWAFAASGSVTPTLPTHQSGDMLLVRVAYKSSAIATCLASTATSGWAKLGEFHDGTVNSGANVGSVAVALFWKIAASASETNPQIDFSQTVTQVGHVALSYQKTAAPETWDTPTGDGGPDTTADTSKSMTIQSHVAVKNGDMVDFFMGIRDDTTMTVPTITQTGVTFGTVSEQPAVAGISTVGDDGAYDGGNRLATAGTSSAAAVVTGTLSTSETGSAWQTRLHVYIAASFVADAIVRAAVSPSFIADAVIQKTQAASFTADAFVTLIQMTSFNANSIIKREIAASFTANAVILKSQSAATAADAIVLRSQSATFTGNAVLRAAATAAFTANAVQLKTTTAGLNADAVILRGRLDGYTANAVLLSPRASSFTADAFVMGPGGFAVLNADAVIKVTRSASVTADAWLRLVTTTSFTANATIFRTQARTLSADAVLSTFIPHQTSFSANAWVVALHFDFIVAALSAATITATMTTEATQVSRSFTADAVKV